MSQIELFMRPESLFSVVGELATQYQMIITFRRFRTERFPAGLRVVDAGDDLAGIYRDGGYVRFYLSLSAKPQNELDLQYPPNTVAPEILEFDGGRMVGKDVEQCVARPLAKKTIVSRQFEALRRRLNAKCGRGVVEPKTGTEYPKIYWERELPALGLVLRRSMPDDPVEFRPMQPGKKRQ